MKRRILSLILVISCMAIGLMAAAFYLLNKDQVLTGFEQNFRQTTNSPDNPGHLSATFLGTSTLLFSDANTSIMIDGFFTRPDIGTLLWGHIEPNIPLIEASLERLNVKKLAAVMVVHSHHDHAMDAPDVAKLTSAIVFGSESTANIARARELPETQIEVVDNTRSLQFGAFKVTMIKSQHTPVPPAMAWLTGIGEEITEPLPQPTALMDYKEGGSYAVYIEHPLGNVLVQASGGYLEGLLTPYSADVIFLGIAGLSQQSEQFKAEYFKETIDALGAKRIIPIHWDNFMRPIGKGLHPMPPEIDNIPHSLTELSSYIEGGKGSLIMMQAWDSIVLY